jgi:transcriptional regulator PpsR
VTAKGLIEDVHCNIQELDAFARGIPGRHMQDTVTEESVPKIDEMIAAALGGEEPRWREINHLINERGDEFPVRYQAVKAGDMVLFFGRELGAVAALQSRLMRAQRALDQDYGRLRQMETRYRVLFHTITEPVMIVDAASGKIQEANDAAARLVGNDARELSGTPLTAIFEKQDRAQVEQVLETLRQQGGSATIKGRAENSPAMIEICATLFRAADAIMLLCRIDAGAAAVERENAVEQMLTAMVGQMTDAVVVTDLEGRITWCNDAFLSMAEIALPGQAQGEPLARFLGRPGVDIDVILANARKRGRLRSFSAVLQGAFGSTTRIDISAAALGDAQPQAVGFVMRDISRNGRSGSEAPAVAENSVANLMELVGSVPLKELIRASTDQIEKICIEAALQMTGNNRASAAEMLGLSRQSLYLKLRRFGLINQGDDD